MKKKLLFVCAANLNRSPTFERYFKDKIKKYEVRSTGCYYGYPYRLDEKIVKWADIIYVMDMEQWAYIQEHYSTALNKVKIIGISDQYNTNDERLITLIELWVENLMEK